MKPVKVLYVITVRMAYEGITMSALNFVRNIDRGNVHIDFVAIGEPEGSLRREIEQLGGTVHVLPGRLRNPAAYLLKLMRIIRRGKYDAVHVHGNSCTMAIELMAAWLGGAKVRIAHSHNSYCKFMKAHKLLRPLFDRLYTEAFACGEEAGRWLFPGKQFRIIRNATESAKYAFDAGVRAEYRKKLGFGTELVIGSVANMNEQKNHRFMLDVFAQLRKVRNDVKLVLVGDGVLRADIESRISELGIGEDVLVLGTRTDVPALLQAFDVMLLPSLYEGFPCVLVEWQCAGLRALVSDSVTSDADLTGLLTYLPIDKGADAWVRDLKDMSADDRRETTSAEAIEKIRLKGYDIRENARELGKLYISAVNNGH